MIEKAFFLRLAAFLLIAGGMLSSVHAQSTVFGKNKVQYHKFNYYYIQSDHFDVYFTEGGRYLAEFTAIAAESSYVSISKSIRYQLVNRVPIIVYNSHDDFQQTNVISEYLEEGIGGVTELFKNRVVIPFEGDYKKFRHVIHHELVHAVLNDMFYGGSIQSIIANNITLQLPGWLNEGLAEYEPLRWDTDSDMFLRDATVHEYLPSIQNLNGYFAYRGGQSVWWYISNKYGEQKIGEILNRIKSTRSVEAGFKGAIGLGLQELSERWEKEQKVLYWPDIAKREEPADYARALTDSRKDGSFYNTSPAMAPAGDRIAFISNRQDYFDVYIMNSVDGTIMKKIVNGQTTADFEELNLLTPGLSWSPDGTRIAIATKAGAQNAILIINVETGDQEKLEFGLDGIYSVDWSHQGDLLAFVGNKLESSDIYTYNLKSKELTNLTQDKFSDSDPSFSADGKTIFFSSDRGDHLSGDVADMNKVDYSQHDLYSIALATKKMTRLTDWPNSDEESPVSSEDNRSLLFVSDKNGINNVYKMNLKTGDTVPVTNSLSGVYQLSISYDCSKMVFSSLVYGGFNLFLMRNPFDRDLKIASLEPTEFFKKKFNLPVAAATADSARIEPIFLEDELAAVKDSTAVDSTASASTAGNDEPYGKDIQIDFSNYVFGETKSENIPSDSTIARLPRITQNIDENGDFKVNKYKLNFSPDIIYGNAGYDTFYGVTGSTVMAFSDLLGNHQIVFVTNLLLDLKNSDYGLQYFYLPERVDFGFSAFHSARFVIIDDPYGGSLYRFRTFGASVAASFPMSRFNRMEFGLNWYNIQRENLDIVTDPLQKRTVLVPSFSYVHDNALWGYTSPINGSRYNFTVFGTPKVGDSGLEFVNITGDYRTYIRLGRAYSLALRLAGGGSFGRNPQKFVLGGVDGWINRTFEGGYIPIENAEDFIFLQTGVPLRGYNYNAAIGSKYTLFNMELRYPLFAFLQAGPLPIGLQSIGGSLFFDMGAAWNKERNLVLFTHDQNGDLVTRDLLMGMGTGARIYFLAFLVRFDVAWAWNVSGFSQPKYYFSLGSDF